MGRESNLKSIQDFAQKVVEAIAAVIDYEVAIIDENLEVIAGTGIYQEQIGFVYGEGSITSQLLQSPFQDVIEIDEPHSSPICKECSYREDCIVKGALVCPISFEGENIGSLWLFAFDTSAKDRLLREKKKLGLFLTKIASFVSSTIGEREMKERVTYMVKQFQGVINSVHEGIIALDEKGRVSHINEPALKILEIKESEFTGKSISRIFSSLDLSGIFKDAGGQNPYYEKELTYKKTDKRLRLLCTITPLRRACITMGAVISFRKIEEIQRLASRIFQEEKKYTFEGIRGTSLELVKLKKRMMRVAATDSTILIRGESGTGKELFAKAIHNASNRKENPFIAINCGALPESLLESELFGYDEGAFTGARRKGKPGKFELADRGTIFLDEIGDMPAHLQVNLLRALEEREIERVGGVKRIPIDVRIVAATNQNLEKRIREGHFREDLYFRLNVIPFFIPPLRERRDDIPLLMHFFLDRYNFRLNKALKGFTRQAQKVLMSYSWPGNVRELENAVEYAVNIEVGEEIGRDSLPQNILGEFRHGDKRRDGFFTLEELERQAILGALKRYGSSGEGKARAAEELGISRATLYRKLKRWGLSSLSHNEIMSHYEIRRQERILGLI